MVKTERTGSNSGSGPELEQLWWKMPVTVGEKFFLSTVAHLPESTQDRGKNPTKDSWLVTFYDFPATQIQLNRTGFKLTGLN